MKFVRLSAYCQNCGENISSEIAFCRSCGTALSESQVQANMERVRERQKGASSMPLPTTRKIAGTVVVGLLEVLFVAFVFLTSLVISINFFPDITEGQSGHVLTYLIVMLTAYAALTTVGAYLSKKFREKYPRSAAILKQYYDPEKNA